MVAKINRGVSLYGAIVYNSRKWMMPRHVSFTGTA